MSVRAYPVIEIERDNYNDEWNFKGIIQRKKPLFNCWSEWEILDIFTEYGNTNQYSDGGYIEISDEGFDEFLEYFDEHRDEYDDYVSVIDDMIKLFDTYGLKYLGCNCY